MITKYDEFLLEQFITMINESEVVFSNKFRKLLKTIESPIAKALMDIENKDLKVTSNYLDVADNKDSISFIPDRKAQEILKDKPEKYATFNGTGGILTHNMQENGTLFNLLGYEPKGERGYKPEVGEKGLVVSRATSPSSGNVYLYMKFDNGECVLKEERVNYEDYLKDVWTKNRQTVRTGRAIQALLSAADYAYKAAEVEEFVNKYKSAFEKMNDAFSNFELVEGDKIGYWYSARNYADNKGTLSNSCMAHVPKSFFDIYMSNPDVCKLLILKDETGEKIKGRALVWKLQSPEGVTFVDRVYTHNDSDVELFREYAKSQGWYYKPRNDSSDSSEMISPTGEKVDMGPLVVKIRKGEYDQYPYVDTIKHFNPSAGTLSTSSKGNTMCLEDTDGGGGDECEYCGGSGEVECYDCEGSGTMECDECDGKGHVDCNDCDGDGKLDCPDCDGEGEVECEDCDGSGKDDDGEDCSGCEGKGKVTCGDCEGEGKKECPDCDGKGTVECDDCSGRGETECGNCDGSGYTSCPEC
jgi:hypothetical protein